MSVTATSFARDLGAGRRTRAEKAFRLVWILRLLSNRTPIGGVTSYLQVLDHSIEWPLT